MCPLTLETSISSGDKDGFMTDATWDEVKAMARQCQSVIIAGFGEPMTNPEFREMMRELDDEGISFSFSTNGIGFEKFAADLATYKHLNHVNISIDSPDPAVYREIRGGELSRAISGARAIADALRGTKVPVTIAAVIMKSNAWSLLGFPPLLQEMGLKVLVISSLESYRQEMAQEHLHTAEPLKVLPDKPPMPMGEIVTHLHNLCHRMGITLFHSERLTLDSLLPIDAMAKYHGEPGPGVARACAIPFETMYVDAAGRVFPCCHASSGPILGEVGKQTLQQIWEGDVSRSFRNALLDGTTTPSVCRKCTVAPLGEHPMKLYAAEVSLAEYRAEGGIRLKVRNTGSFTWSKSQAPLLIGTARPLDRGSHRWVPSWHATSRIAVMKEEVVAPGCEATLEFELGPAPDGPAEYFQFVIEGRAWVYGTLHSYKPEPALFGAAEPVLAAAN